MTKAADAFRTISEVSEELDVPKHVLRFWEQKFPQIKPMKRGGGRRYYRPEDLELLRGIRHLLHAEAYTIKGVQKILRTQGIEAVKHAAAAAEAAASRGVRGRRKTGIGASGQAGASVTRPSGASAHVSSSAVASSTRAAASAPLDVAGVGNVRGTARLRRDALALPATARDAVLQAVAELEACRGLLREAVAARLAAGSAQMAGAASSASAAGGSGMPVAGTASAPGSARRSRG